MTETTGWLASGLGEISWPLDDHRKLLGSCAATADSFGGGADYDRVGTASSDIARPSRKTMAARCARWVWCLS
ncbi:hypothetical protein [Streptomyces sp. NPDC057199]|uniref:hypothetical protein n=1 Tax=Streptomyces sp. NPDC057199 TaxID=3346047 RepID=UPI003644A5A0